MEKQLSCSSRLPRQQLWWYCHSRKGFSLALPRDPHVPNFKRKLCSSIQLVATSVGSTVHLNLAEDFLNTLCFQVVGWGFFLSYVTPFFPELWSCSLYSTAGGGRLGGISFVSGYLIEALGHSSVGLLIRTEHLLAHIMKSVNYGRLGVTG
jgi:hypothetical protein